MLASSRGLKGAVKVLALWTVNGASGKTGVRAQTPVGAANPFGNES